MSKKRLEKTVSTSYSNFQHVTPATKTQQQAFDAWDEGDHLVLAGSAGTGKTYQALYLALKAIVEDDIYRQVVIIRSAVPTRNQGFMPGDKEQKEDSYQAPYKSVCSELFNDTHAYAKLVGSEKLRFESTSYIRGVTFNQSIIIVDEMQNLNFHELDSVITRVGQDCRIIFCGDYKQTDFTNRDEKSGIFKFLNILEVMKNFSVITFGWEDIVRSGLVRDYIMTKEMLNVEE